MEHHLRDVRRGKTLKDVIQGGQTAARQFEHQLLFEKEKLLFLLCGSKAVVLGPGSIRARLLQLRTHRPLCERASAATNV